MSRLTAFLEKTAKAPMPSDPEKDEDAAIPGFSHTSNSVDLNPSKKTLSKYLLAAKEQLNDPFLK